MLHNTQLFIFLYALFIWTYIFNYSFWTKLCSFYFYVSIYSFSLLPLFKFIFSYLFLHPHNHPTPETCLLLLTTSIISDLFISIPCLSSAALMFTERRHEMRQQYWMPLPTNPSAEVELRAHVNVDRCKWSFTSRFVWSGRVDFITGWGGGDEAIHGTDCNELLWTDSVKMC
jgi:hypothetical protein